MVWKFRRCRQSQGISGTLFCTPHLSSCNLRWHEFSNSVLFCDLCVRQSWVYSGVALIPFQVYSRSGVDPDCSTPWSRIYAARLIPFHWSRGVSIYSSLWIFPAKKLVIFFSPLNVISVEVTQQHKQVWDFQSPNLSWEWREFSNVRIDWSRGSLLFSSGTE